MNKLFEAVKIVLRGIGQIMLQENAFTGLVFLVGIGLGSLTMALGALVATSSATVAAVLLRFNPEHIRQGLYGFSAALVGVALTLFFQAHWYIWLAIVLLSMAAACLQHFFIRHSLPVFTLPFVLLTWLAWYFFTQVYPVEPAILSFPMQWFAPQFSFVLWGYAQVIFQAGALIGLLFFLAVFIHSPVAALYGLAASLLAGLFALLFQASPDSVAQGLLSYNAVLCAIVFVGTSRKDGFFALSATLLSVLFTLFMHRFTLPTLTFPFVLASFIMVYVKQISFKFFKNNL